MIPLQIRELRKASLLLKLTLLDSCELRRCR